MVARTDHTFEILRAALAVARATRWTGARRRRAARAPNLAAASPAHRQGARARGEVAVTARRGEDEQSAGVASACGVAAPPHVGELS